MYGHHHLNVTSIAAHRKFWIDTLRGTPVSSRSDVIVFPNVLIFMDERQPTGGTKGTPVDHIAFGVPNLGAMVEIVKAAGYQMVTRAELPPRYDVHEDRGFINELNGYVAFVMAPDETKVEFVENETMTAFINAHHIHFAAANVPDMMAWYVKTFRGTPGKRGPFDAVDLPGINLSWSACATSREPTEGRVLDHIGLEIANLKDFCRQLEADGVTFKRPYSEDPGTSIGTALIRDPWGTSIELTEGFAAYS
jgi:catechol 2,3-dioxygenase-like lactoylglutathione lyase family enzyme